ncbi:MAG: SDR family oxidoreductase [Myxococcota bacterium]|nr:SDR family oxidoreductase [Myxococcota bacterium]
MTGSTTGLGYAIAKALAAAGAKVVLNYCHDERRATDAIQQLRSFGADAILIRADITKPDAIQTMLRHVENRVGHVDVAVLNATPAQPQHALEDYAWSDFEMMHNAFVKSPVLITQGIVPHMKRQKWGRIINIGSEVVDEAPSHFSAYVAAKGGQHALTRCLATELAPWGITVNTVSPGWIPVERHRNVPQADKDAYFTTIPAGRWGSPTDVAHAVTFLASNESSFITGANLRVNGGRTPPLFG